MLFPFSLPLPELCELEEREMIEFKAHDMGHGARLQVDYQSAEKQNRLHGLEGFYKIHDKIYSPKFLTS